MASIRKRGDRWQVQVRRQGCAPLNRSFRRKADAHVWACQMEAEADRRGLPPNRASLLNITLGDILRRYADTIVISKRCRDVESIILSAVAKTRLAKLSLARLASSDIAEYRDARLSTVKAVTVNRELALIQHALDIAQREWGIPLRENPVRHVRRSSLGPPRDRRLRDGEFDRLIDQCRQCRNPLMKPLIQIAVETGMRQGELLRCHWGDVSLKTQTLCIPVTKNGHPRTIPLTKAAIETLALLAGAEVSGSTRLFPMTAGAVKLAWRRLTRRSGLIDLHFHDLRHEAISRFFERGLTIPEVALISGHRDVRMLFRYTHLRAEDLAAKLNGGPLH
jgi:integrase